MRNIKIFFMSVLFLLSTIVYALDEVNMNQNNFQNFLDDFISKVELKEEQLNRAVWILETTGSKDAASLVGSLSSELKILFSDKDIYEKIVSFNKEEEIDPLLKRQIHILINAFKGNMLPKEILHEISTKEAALNQIYANFRAKIDGKVYSENSLRDILRKEKSVDLRKKAWDASKIVGIELAPKIVELAHLRNKAANNLGYENYFEMMLDLSDINKIKLLKTFDDLKNKTDESFNKILLHVNETLSNEFKVSLDEIGPWAYKDPFCQMDPIETSKLNELFQDKDLLKISKSFYEQMGFKVDDLIDGSDLYERDGKNQHAFCISVNRKKDVRTLNNIKPNVQWMETLLHEFGHGIYDLEIDENLPWLLREHPHILTTEAIALLMGRQVYTKEFLRDFLDVKDEKIFNEVENGLKRRQLFFSRSAFMITEFEAKMYEDPNQDLNTLWWDLYEKYYKSPRPEDREDKADWAAKYHVGLAPVYYYSYLLGEVFASTLQKQLLDVAKDDNIWKKDAAIFLKDKMFSHGSKYRWDQLIENVLDSPFSIDDWVEECSK
ncbi:MAG: hypothetical protein K1060chlam3_00685 [Candidatus Anoxychlamydiales bacterium]|nr:hypothetical protein [Candidatus Anoxychlamydiales bacterium]